MWVHGRNKTGYLKKLLWQVTTKRIQCDGYLLYYPEGSHIPPHIDIVPNKRHWRINLVYNNCSGGIFKSDAAIINLGWLNIFRSDKPHEVSKITKGYRYVLSIGIAL